MARLWIGVWPPPEVLEALGALRREPAPGVRWITPEQWHVTLRFLGRADPDDAIRALASLGHPPVTATLGPSLGRLGRGLVVVPVAGLDSLAAEVARITAEVGQPSDVHPFFGHLTLARLKAHPACGLGDDPLSAVWTIGEVALVESDTRASGVEYHTLTTAPLGVA